MRSTIGFRPSLGYGAQRVERKNVRWYQADGSQWLADPRHRVLADPMRAGKTMQWLLSLPRHARAIMVAPKISHGVWIRECREWRDDLRPSPGKVRRPCEGELIIASYDSLPDPVEGWAKRLIREELSDVFLGFDECHLIKSADADRTERCRLLALQCLRVNGLSATPMPGTIADLWGVLSSCRAVWPWENQKAFVADSMRDDFSERLKLVVMRRDWSVIAPDMPPITVQEIPIDVPPRLKRELDALYDTWDVKAGALPAIGHGSHVLRRLAESRIEDSIQVCRSVLAQAEPLLFFSCYQEPVIAMGRIAKSGVMTGDTSEEERARLVVAFQRGEIDLLACTADTGGVSVELSRASVVVENDQDWTPDVNNQAIARAVRLDKRKPVHVYRLGTPEHPLEKRLADVRKRKEELNGRILKGLR